MIKFILCICMFCVSCSQENRPLLVPMGIVDGHLQGYTQPDIANIKKDYKNIKVLSFSDKTPVNHPVYLATAGGPGALKSTTLENILAAPEYKNYVYVDPDPRALKLMINTYISQSLSFSAISKAASFQEAQVRAYEYWRGGSNYIATSILNKAFKGFYNIAHGTTSTSPAVEKIYKTLKANGYVIKLILCYATDETRLGAVKHRAAVQANYQSSPEDVVNKGKMFPRRFPIYFTYADTIDLYWADTLIPGSRKVAVINKGLLTVVDDEGYASFVSEYTKAVHSTDMLGWSDLLRSHNITVATP